MVLKNAFSSPAVVTVWALFILSAGLTRTGIAHQLGRPLQRFTKRSEAVLMAALMVAASLLSALINTVTVAAILLPATMDLAREKGSLREELDRQYHRVAAVPFDSDRKFMTTFHPWENGRFVSFTKGAVEEILERSIISIFHTIGEARPSG